MKPMAIKTEFSFSISRDYINVITDRFEGGLFENLDVKFGKLNGHNALKNTHVVYTLSKTIQTVGMANINANYINRVQQQHKDIFFSRIADVKDKLCHMQSGKVKIKTMVSFVDEISISL